MPLDPLSPLAVKMWSPELIASSWERREPIDSGSLRRLPNVAEWCSSSKERNDAFDSLVAEALADMQRWGAEPRGVIPCGVGSLAVAVVLTDGAGVAKWMPETGSAHRAAAMAAALHTADIGPALLASSDRGILLARVEPGVPLRSLPHDESLVVEVARLLPRVRALDPAVLDGLPRTDPIAEMASAEYSDLLDETDGFSDRALVTARAALHAVEGLSRVVGHRDVQLGNVLAGSDGRLYLIDADGSADAGYDDAARLVTHATVDAWGRAQMWDVNLLLEQVAAVAQLDEGVLRVVALAKAAGTARYIRRCVPERAWEWRAADQLCSVLDA